MTVTSSRAAMLIGASGPASQPVSVLLKKKYHGHNQSSPIISLLTVTLTLLLSEHHEKVFIKYKRLKENRISKVTENPVLLL